MLKFLSFIFFLPFTVLSTTVGVTMMYKRIMLVTNREQNMNNPDWMKSQLHFPLQVKRRSNGWLVARAVHLEPSRSPQEPSSYAIYQNLAQGIVSVFCY